MRQQLQDWPGNARTRQQLAIAYNNYGVQLGDHGQWALAIEQFGEAMRLDDANQKIRENLAHLYLNQAQQAFAAHQPPEALEAVGRALALMPSFIEAYALQGEIEYSRQNLKEAKAAWAHAVALDPTQEGLAERLNQVTQELPVESKFERSSQASFDVRFEEELARPVNFDVRDALLRARREVGMDFACWPKHKIIVLVYSAEKFREIRRTTPDWVAGQFDGKIRVPLPGDQLDSAQVSAILFHEYTHALIHELAGEACPKWLNEGLAEYEGRRQYRPPLRYLPAALATGTLSPWSELSDHFANTLPVEHIAFAYEQSYSVAHYLISRYGFWRIRRLLQLFADGRPWEAALSEEFQLKLPRLETAWRDWLPEWLQSPGQE